MGLKTTFILGAGASVPYGYPTAMQLVQQIQERPILDSFYLEPNFRSLAGLEDAPVKWQTVSMVREFLQRLSKSRPPSIDTFLEYPANSDLVDLGKCLIAANLLHSMVKQNRPSISEDLYGYLGDYMFLRSGDFNTDIRFVTFNYDLSLEMAIAEMAEGRFGLSPEEADEMVRKLPITHVYGRLYLPEDVRYPELRHKRDPRWATLAAHSAAAGIRVMGDDRAGGTLELQDARGAIFWAERLVFLGFSYNPINLKRLGIGGGNHNWLADLGEPGAYPVRSIFGSGYGLYDKERQVARSLLDRPGTLHAERAEIGQSIHKCVEFLKEHVALNYRGA